VAGRPVDADALVDMAAQPDDGSRQGVDRDLEAEDHGTVGVEADDRGGAAGRALRLGRFLDREVRRGQLADEGADGAAGQAGPGDELGA
jgi:hypothetical protein